MIGIILGFCCALAFGVNAIVTRRGVLRASSNYVANISIFSGIPFFFFAAAVTGDIYQIDQYPWQTYFYLALSGVIHFAFGRTWSYKSIQLIGATRAYVATSLYPVVSIGLAMIVLKETVRPLGMLGILFSLAGPFLTVMKEKTVPNGIQSTLGLERKELDRHTLYLGMLYGVGGAIFWGSSFIFIKLGLESGGAPVAGTLIAYSAASVAISPPLFLNRESKRELFKKDQRALLLALTAGLTSNVAQLLRYLALACGSVIVVTILIRTSPLWVLLFSFLFNREYESFSRWVLLGNSLLVAGTLLILIS